jgi:hypothetical protein
MNHNIDPPPSFGAWLRHGDPATALSPGETEQLRQEILRAADASELHQRPRRSVLALRWSAVAVVPIVALAFAVLRSGTNHPHPTQSGGIGGSVAEAPLHVHELQFRTPGGTRIIWTFGPPAGRPWNGEQLR